MQRGVGSCMCALRRSAGVKVKAGEHSEQVPLSGINVNVGAGQPARSNLSRSHLLLLLACRAVALGEGRYAFSFSAAPAAKKKAGQQAPGLQEEQESISL